MGKKFATNKNEIDPYLHIEKSLRHIFLKDKIANPYGITLLKLFCILKLLCVCVKIYIMYSYVCVCVCLEKD